MTINPLTQRATLARHTVSVLGFGIAIGCPPIRSVPSSTADVRALGLFEQLLICNDDRKCQLISETNVSNLFDHDQ
jgi:hypothetical protein